MSFASIRMGFLIARDAFTFSMTNLLILFVSTVRCVANRQRERREAAAAEGWFVLELNGYLSFAPRCG